jgi:hypothetical protein
MLIVPCITATILDSDCTTGGTTNALARNATNCQDVYDTTKVCAVIFKTTATAPAVHKTECLDPDLEETALNCAFTCGICCKTAPYVCGDDPLSTVNCESLRNRCNDPSMAPIMSRYCQGTCGLCESGVGCTDLNTDCYKSPGLCNDINFQSYVQTQCRKTCGLCATSSVTTTTTTVAPGGGTTCSDIATNCAANVGLCNNSAYFTLMTQKCPRTCNRCSSSIPSTSCIDTDANCAAWVRNGFCSNTFYTSAQKQQYCARSCNLCTSG